MEGNYLSKVAPRVFLLRALCANVEKLQSQFGQQQWASISSGLTAALEATREEVLGQLPNDGELKKVARHVFEKKYNVVLLGGQITQQYTRIKNTDDESLVLAVNTMLALFVSALDKHLLAFLSKNPYVSAVVALVSGFDLPRRASSTWGKFLDTYNPSIMPTTQQFGLLAVGLILINDLIAQLHAPYRFSQLPTNTTTLSSALQKDHVVVVTNHVFVVTDRRDIWTRNTTIDQSGSLEDLSYGDVTVAYDPTSKRPTTLDQVHYVGDTRFEHNYTSFIQSINSHLALLDKEAGNSSPTTDVLIFIHGFSTEFGEGDINRAAQIKHDMNLFGTSIAYCWSSHGTLDPLGYLADEIAIAATIPYLASFIKLCITQVKARRLHILAHSIGNRAMIGALSQIYEEIINNGSDWVRTGLPLKNVISAAADWTVSEFQGMVDGAKQIFGADTVSSEYRPHFSVYSSTDDQALQLSAFIHGQKFRLGLTGAHFEEGVVTLSEPPQTGFIDVIDASGYKNSIHMYFATEADVLLDMQQLISVPGKERAYWRASDDGPITNVEYHYNGQDFKLYSFDPTLWPKAVPFTA